MRHCWARQRQSTGQAGPRHGRAGEAKAHLLRKLAWLEDKGLVQNTEQFIERAASKSSISGEPYLVRCGNGTPVDSGTWMRAQLKAMRSAERAPAPGVK